MAKKTKDTVTLSHTPQGGKKITREFSMAHALNLLRMKKPSWKLDDENYKFEQNDLVKTGSNSATQETN
jgi:hypothetical protein